MDDFGGFLGLGFGCFEGLKSEQLRECLRGDFRLKKKESEG